MSGLLGGYWLIARKELLHLQRDPATLVIALMIPIVQLTLIGFALDFDIRHIPTAVVDLDRSSLSRDYVQRLVNTEYLQVVSYLPDAGEAEAKMRAGQIRVVVIIPPDFSRLSVPGQTPQVRVLIDGSDNQVATRARLAFFAPPDTAAPGFVEPRINVLYNPDMRTQTFMIPGLIGVILQLVTVSLTAFSLVREREQGTLEQLMVTPVSRLGLILGKLTPYAGLALTEVAAVLYLGDVIFDVHVAGSIVLLILMSIPFVLAALSLGLLISTIAQNQGQALQLTMLITMPTILLSGFVFPREQMPGVIYLVSFLIPVTYYLEIIRGIVVRGAGFMDLWPSFTALVAISLVLIALATARFRKNVV